MNKEEIAIIRCKELVLKRDALKYRIAKISLTILPYKTSSKYAIIQFSKKVGVHSKELMFWRDDLEYLPIKDLPTL